MRFSVQGAQRLRSIACGTWWTLPVASTLGDGILAIRLPPSGERMASAHVLAVEAGWTEIAEILRGTMGRVGAP